MRVSAATIACFLGGLVCFIAACVAIWWAASATRTVRRLKQRLQQADRQLDYYRATVAGQVENWAENVTEDGDH